MAALNGIVTRLFDVICGPLGGHAAWAMVLISAVTGLWAMWLFKLATPQRRLARQRDRLLGHIYEMGMYQDHLGVLARIQKDLALANLRYLSLTLPALLVLIVPMVLTLAQLEGRFAHRPLKTGESAVLRVGWTDGADPAAVDLRLPDGLELAAGPVRDPATGQAAWRLRALEAGRWPVTVTAAGEPCARAVITVGGGLPLLGGRLGATWWEKLLYPGWQPLPAGSPVATLDVDYPSRSTTYLGVELNWLVAFMILSLATGLAMKDALGVEL